MKGRPQAVRRAAGPRPDDTKADPRVPGGDRAARHAAPGRRDPGPRPRVPPHGQRGRVRERPAWQLADGTQTGWAARGVLASYLHLHWGRAVRRRNPPSPDRPRSPPSRPMSQDHRWRSRSGRGIALGSTSGPRPPTGSPNPSPGRRRIHDWCVSTKSTLYVHTIRQLQERGAEPTVGVCPPAMRHKQSPGWRLATPSARVSRPACGASWPISNDWCPASHRAATSSRWPAQPACSPPWASNISSALSAG